VKKRKPYIRRHPYIPHRKYTLDQNYFEKIDSQEKAYFLGFLYADGGIAKNENTCTLNLQMRDKVILGKFKILVNYSGPLRKKKDQKEIRLCLCSRKMKKDLVDKGCIPQKTFKLTFPHWLSEDLKRHFIRGYFDGDGSVGIYNSNKRTKNKYLYSKILGRKKFLEHILSHSSIQGYLHKEGNLFRLNFCSVHAKQFLSWLYQDATIYLERKHDKFLEYLKTRRNYARQSNKFRKKVCNRQ